MKFTQTVAVLCMLASFGCSRNGTTTEDRKLAILYNVEEQGSEKNPVAQVLQSQLSAKGIDVRLEPVSNTVFYDRVGKGDFECAYSLWYLDYDDPEGFLTDFYSKAGFRLSKYSSPFYDQLYLSALLAPNPKQRLDNFRKAAAFLDDELPWVPLYSNSEIFLLKPGTEGFKANAYQYYDYRTVARPYVRAASDVEVQTLDPALAYDLASKHLVTQSYEGLVSMDENRRMVPALAEEWAFDSKWQTLTFKLRQNVHFHGTDRIMTATDVKASYERMLRANSPYGYIFDFVEGVKDFKAGKAKDARGFQAIDSHTFRLSFTQPFPMMLPWMLAPATAVLPAGTALNFDFANGSVGTGAFVLQSWKDGVASFTANTRYWKRDAVGKLLPYAKTLAIRVMKDTNTELAAFRQGELDILNVPLASFDQVFDTSGKLRPEWKSVQSREVKLNNLKFLGFNMQRKPWGTDVNLRRAVNSGIDRKSIVTQLLFGKGQPSYSIVPPEMWEQH
jgi:ABC-type transport system substrate-binding protein